MYIPVVLRDGQELTVDKERFQYLLITKQILFFKRTNGWVVVGRDQMRGAPTPHKGKERRNKEVYAANYW